MNIRKKTHVVAIFILARVHLSPVAFACKERAQTPARDHDDKKKHSTRFGYCCVRHGANFLFQKSSNSFSNMVFFFIPNNFMIHLYVCRSHRIYIKITLLSQCCFLPSQKTRICIAMACKISWFLQYGSCLCILIESQNEQLLVHRPTFCQQKFLIKIFIDIGECMKL